LSGSRKAWSLAALAVVVAAAACSDKKKGGGKADDQTAGRRADADDAGARPPSPGLVYFAVNRVGVVELRDGEFRVVLPTEGRFTDFAVLGDDIYAVADAEIRKADGAGGTTVGDNSAPGQPRRIEAGQGDRLWAVTGKGLWSYESGAWTRDDNFPQPRTILDAVSDRRGAVVATARTIAYVKKGDAWAPVPFPPPPPEPTPDGGIEGGDDGADEDQVGALSRIWVRSLEVGADGEIYGVTSSSVFQLEGEAWVEVLARPVSSLAVASDGTLVGGLETASLLIGKPGSLVEKSLADFGLEATEIDAIATDGAGRLWLATDGGLAVAKADGEVLATYVPGTLEALPGRVFAIAVIEPPGVLPEVKPPRTGAVAGRIVRDQAPAAGAVLELCATPDTLFRESPCAEAPHRSRTVANDRGAFRFEGVPAARYGLAIRAKDDWVIDLTVDCCVGLFDGGEVKLKTIRVSR
jgi:hypothetical protein